MSEDDRKARMIRGEDLNLFFDPNKIISPGEIDRQLEREKVARIRIKRFLQSMLAPFRLQIDGMSTTTTDHNDGHSRKGKRELILRADDPNYLIAVSLKPEKGNNSTAHHCEQAIFYEASSSNLADLHSRTMEAQIFLIEDNKRINISMPFGYKRLLIVGFDSSRRVPYFAYDDIENSGGFYDLRANELTSRPVTRTYRWNPRWGNLALGPERDYLYYPDGEFRRALTGPNGQTIKEEVAKAFVWLPFPEEKDSQPPAQL